MFYERLKSLCKERNTTVTNMLSELGLSTGSTGNWKKGQIPKGDILAKIADYLDTSIDYIVFGEYRDNLTDEEKKLVEVYNTAPERAKYKLICDFEDLVEEEKEKLNHERNLKKA
ncbi:MAG: helix-turn-helix domain-containing protein [Clostridia bacterium]|nr:helix-turn-helix domain-containing protein [Clostridia bacterium]